MPWATEGRKTNPAANTVLADSGPLPVGTSYSPQIVASSTVATQILLQRRDAANTTTLTEQLVVCPANATLNIPVVGYISDWQEGERLRLVVNASITGTSQGSLFW